VRVAENRMLRRINVKYQEAGKELTEWMVKTAL
jgi:hypothetical protein